MVSSVAQSDAPSAPVTEAPAKLEGWQPVEGRRQRDPAGFVALVQASPGFWAWDFTVKYLNITIDTRDPAVFWLADRDNNPIHPQRVLDAIERQRLGRLPARLRSVVADESPAELEAINGRLA